MMRVVSKFFIASVLMWAVPVSIIYGFNHNLFPVGDGGAQSCNTDFVHAIVVLDPDMVERVGKICVAARSDGVASFKSKSLAKSKQGSKSTTPKNTIHDAGSESEDSSHKNLLLDYTVGGHSAAVSSV
ncbi:hypothetical protein OROGR_012047 [Orobanche gracilis]